MSIDRNKELARKFYEVVLNKGDVDLLDEITTAGYVEHDPLPGQGTGRDGVKDRVNMLRAGLQPQFTLEDVIAEGDKVVVRWTNSGRHVGEFLGIPPTNKDFTIAGIDIFVVRDGRLAEHWHVVDQLAMLGQLGLLPPMGPQ